MTEVSLHFNLVDEPWLPVKYRDGTAGELSLREVFHRAPSIRCLVGDIPQQEVPMLRLCEAVVYRLYTCACLADLTHEEMLDEWEEHWKRGSFDSRVIDSYLDKFYGRFDLFGEMPFLQVPGLAYQSDGKPYDSIAEILADVPKPGKFLFSMRAKGSLEGISCAEAARWLLFFLAYDVAGIKTPVVGNLRASKGKVYAPKGLPGVGWLGSIGSVFVEGRSLFETLMLNWVMYDNVSYGGDVFRLQDDLPPWERSASSADSAAVSPSGPVSLFTLQSRRLRLVPDPSGSSVIGIVSCYGDIVRPTEARGRETMTAWRESTKQQKALGLPFVPLMPQVHDCSRALWRGLGPLLARGTKAGKRDLRPAVIRWNEELREEGVEGLPKTLCVHAQGVEYGSQSSVVTNAYDDSLDLGDAMLRRDSVATNCAIETVDLIDKAVFQLACLVRNLESSAGGKRDAYTVNRVSDDVKERAYLSLDELARNSLRSFTADQGPGPYCQQWRDAAKAILLRLGNDYVVQSGTSRFIRRENGSVTESFAHFRRQLDRILDVS